MLLVASSSAICSTIDPSSLVNEGRSNSTYGFNGPDDGSDAETDAAEPVRSKCSRVRKAVHFAMEDNCDGDDDVMKTVHAIPHQEFDSDIYYSAEEKKMMTHRAIRQAFVLRMGIISENCINHLYRADSSCPSHIGDDSENDEVIDEEKLKSAATQDDVALATLSKEDARGLEEIICEAIPTNRVCMRQAVLNLQARLDSLGRHSRIQKENLLRAQSLNFSRQSRDFAFKLALADQRTAEEIAKELTTQFIAMDEIECNVIVQDRTDLLCFDFV